MPSLFLTTLGFVLALFWGFVVGTLMLGWGAFALWCGVAMRRQRSNRLVALHTLEALERWCGGEFPQVEDTVQYLRRIVLEDAESLDNWRETLRRKYTKDYGASGTPP